MRSTTSERPAGSWPGLPARALHLFVLWGFAVVQPLLDMLGRGAELFVAHGARRSEIVGLTLGLCLLVPILMTGVEMAAARVAPTAGRAIHRLLVASLAAAATLQLLTRLLSVPGAPLVAAALVCGAAGAWAYGRLAALRTYLSILAPAPLVFAAIFLGFSPVSKLVFPARSPPVAAIDAAAPAQRHPVVLVVFDELSLPTLMDLTQRIDAVRYPNFAALAAASHWFRNATATADSTALAVPALLTGRYFAEGHDRVPVATAASYPRNLFTLLSGSYRLNVVERVTDLCPDEVCGRTRLGGAPENRMSALVGDLWVVYLHRLLPADLTAGLPPIDRQWGHFAGERGSASADGKATAAGSRPGGGKVRIMAAFQDAVRADPGDGALHFLHSGLPHVPWRYLPSGRHYGTRPSRLTMNGPGIRNGIWVDEPWPVLHAFQRYLLQLAFLDRLLGDLLRTLRETGWYDRALVIVTADHGISFQPGRPNRVVDRHNFADIMSVPLFVKLPHQRQGSLSDRNVELIDVLPTIVEVLGLETPWPMDGSSVFDAAGERRQKRLFLGQGKRRPPLTVDVAAMDARTRTVERMVDVFGPSSDPLARYRIGPRPELFGRPLAELEIEAEPRYRVRLRAPEVYDDVDPTSGFVPARVIGTLRSPELRRGPLELAVAVGGTVWATTYLPMAQALFTAMVPESALVAGRNQVEVFVIAGTRERPRLIPTLDPRGPQADRDHGR